MRGPEELRPAFARVRRATTARPAGSATASTGSRTGWPIPVGDRVVETLRVAREVGGSDLGRLLRTLSRVPARGRPHPRRAGDPAGLDGQAARLAVAAPWVVLLLLATQRDLVGAYDQPAGDRVLRRRRRGLAWSPTG